MRVAVVGGGVSGLATAFRIEEAARASQRPLELTLFEAEARLGGKIRSDRHEGFVVETGPNGYLDSKPGTVRLVRDLGLEEEVLPASKDAERRFLFVDGRLQPLPASPPAFLTSSVLPLSGRLRIFLEPLRPRGPDDETLAEFGRRRLGRHAVERLLDPFVTGVFAGDVEQLSVAAAFPAVKRLEQEHGSLIRGMMAKAKARKREGGAARGGATGPGGRLHSLRPGLERIVEALAAAIEGHLEIGAPVQAVERAGESWRVRVGGEAHDFDAVVVATPAPAAASLLEALDASVAEALRETPYASVAVVATGFSAEAIGHDLSGFGFLVPSREGRRILGSLWSSSIYPDHRAPPGQVLLRTLVGGARSPELASLPDDALLALVREELEATMGLRWVEPTHLRIFRWPAAIPQYPVGHLERVARVEARLAERHPGLYLTGNHLHGIGINDCTADAERVAALVVPPSSPSGG